MISTLLNPEGPELCLAHRRPSIHTYRMNECMSILYIQAPQPEVSIDEVPLMFQAFSHIQTSQYPSEMESSNNKHLLMLSTY